MTVSHKDEGSLQGTEPEVHDVQQTPITRELTREEQEALREYPGTAKLVVIMASLYISVFLIALDRTIIGVAIPNITNEFKSTADIGWYGSSYLLTAACFIVFFGKLYTFLDTKWTFLGGIVLFEIGSALCGAAPNSTAFIIGRAIAGLGSSGIFTGAITIMLMSVPLHKRPILQGLFGACFGLASVAGPLVGGAFTQGKAGWRWCFYINLPLGGAAIAAIAFFLHIKEDKPKLTWKQKFFHIDPLGNLFFLPSIICLLLALQWGGTSKPWSDGSVIACLVVFVVLFIAFLITQYLQRHGHALMPTRIYLQRSIIFGGIFQFMLGSAFMVAVLYMPLWFQAIKGLSPVKSGIDTIPMVLGVVVGSIGAGIIVNKVGYYTQFMYIGSVLAAIGCGLLTTLLLDSGHAKWIGYQVLVGLGIGMSMQQSNLAVQVCLPEKDVPVGASSIFFFQTLGGSIFSSVGQNLFIDRFLARLLLIPGVSNPLAIVNTGATALKNAVPRDSLPAVITAYNYSLTHGPILVSTITASMMIIGALGMEWRSVKEKQEQQTGKPAGGKKAPLADEESARASAEDVPTRDSEKLPVSKEVAA